MQFPLAAEIEDQVCRLDRLGGDLQVHCFLSFTENVRRLDFSRMCQSCVLMCMMDDTAGHSVFVTCPGCSGFRICPEFAA